MTTPSNTTDTVTYDLTVKGAQQAADQGELAAWAEAFLASDGSDNAALGEALREKMRHWLGPVQLPFDELHRLAGPADQPTLDRLDEDDLDTVEDMGDSIEEGWTPAPLVVSYRDDQLSVEDGNHRIEGLRRAGETSYWCVVCCATDEDRDRFVAR